LILSLSYEQVGLLITFLAGILAALWLGFLLGLNSCPPVPLPPGASGSSAGSVKFKRVSFEEFD
jgi:hypothetical protein